MINIKYELFYMNEIFYELQSKNRIIYQELSKYLGTTYTHLKKKLNFS